MNAGQRTLRTGEWVWHEHRAGRSLQSIADEVGMTERDVRDLRRAWLQYRIDTARRRRVVPAPISTRMQPVDPDLRLLATRPYLLDWDWR